MASEPFAYDAVLYPTAMPAQMSPARIRGAGVLQGWIAPDPSRARLLEIGGGDGLNALAFAAAFPEAHATHFDLSQVMVERGRKLAAAAGLKNVGLQVGDITTWPREGERYDYIIAHGVYAWAPEEVRRALLRLIGARLKPGGVAYVSFDALPAAATKYELARFLRPHVSHFKTAADGVGAAIAIMRLLAANQRPDSLLKKQLDIFLQILPTARPEHVFHDLLGEHYRPVSLLDFASAAKDAGLAVIGDASLADSYIDDLDAGARQQLARVGQDPVTRGALLDMLHGSNMFRSTLLARIDAPPPPDAGVSSLKDLRFEIMARREEIEEGGRRLVRYNNDRGSTYTPKNAPVEAMLDLLVRESPREVPYAELAAAAGNPDTSYVLAPLRTACVVDLIAAHASPQPFSATAGDKPKVSPLARSMLVEGETAASLRGTLVPIPNNNARRFATLCDGTRTRADLAREMAAVLGAPPHPRDVETNLDLLRRSRLLLS